MSFGACKTLGNFRGWEELGNDACPQPFDHYQQ